MMGSISHRETVPSHPVKRPITRHLGICRRVSVRMALRGRLRTVVVSAGLTCAGPSANVIAIRLVACHGTGAPDGVIRGAGNSVFCKNPRVEPLLPQRSATKRDKESYE